MEGFWFVNVGESEWWINEEESKYNRDWDDCRKYGLLAAGGGSPYSGALQRLEPGAKVVAHMKGRGYVGYGEVTKAAVMARDFIPEGATAPLRQLPLNGLLGDLTYVDDEEMGEWVVGVRWHKTFGRDEAKRFVGAFANQNVVCKLRSRETLDFLRKEFDIPG